MNIKKIELTNTLGHASYGIEMPDTGVVLVTGPNGCGKSSIVEALPVAVWGKTLRGTPPWHTKKKCSAIVEMDGYRIDRTRKGARSQVEVTTDDYDVPAFDTASKAQAWLEHVFGTFDAWRRTHVFSSHDASHFTLATDAERKRLLESLLELSKFDGAASACKVDLKEKKRVLQIADAAVTRLDDRVQHLLAEGARLDEQLVSTSPDGDLSALQQADKRFTACVIEWEEDLKSFRDDIAELKVAGADKRAELKQKLRQLAAIDHDECPTCGQAIGSEMTDPLRKDIDALKQGLQKSEAARVEELETTTADAQQIDRELREHRNSSRDARSKITTWEQAEKMREQMGERINDAKLRVGNAETQLVEQRKVLADEQASVDQLEGVSTVLGLRGVRSQILGKTLTGLEMVANAWLSRIDGPKLTVHLSPVTEKKTGGVSDAIQLRVDGAGGGHGYKAASGGERRRIDVAILLALADISAANSETQGRSSGQDTVFFDEIFDTLDSDGLESVIAITHELACDRVVVVISHSEELAAKLNPTIHVRL